MKIHHRAVSLFLAVSALLIPVSAKTVRLGLVVGHNRGADEDPRLQFAESDAQKMAELFLEVGGMDEDHLILLKSPRPEDMDKAFQEIGGWSAGAAPGDEVVFVFYFSGHGTGDNLKLGRKMYSLRDLKAHIDQIPAKLRIGILDACQSGAITHLKGARMVQPFVLEQQLKSQGSVMITSSSEDENSQESEQLQGSFFTHNLMSALRGAGDVSGDRRVTLLEAYQYAFQKTLVETEDTRGGAQHAKAQMNLDVEGDVVLTDLNSGRAGLAFKADLEGEMLIADARSQVVGEFQKEKGKEAFWALPPGKYRVFQNLGRKTRQFKTQLKDKQIRDVSQDDLTSGFTFSGLAKGGSGTEGVALPWKAQNWPYQYPWEIGIGNYDNSNSGSMLDIIGYRFLPAIGVIAGYSHQWETGPGLFNGRGLQTLRLGAQAGKFLTENIEVLATVFHEAAYYHDKPDYVIVPCTDSSGASFGCLADGPVRRRWHLADATGMYFSGRLWIWNHLSLEIGYGTKYDRREERFIATPLTLLPSLHF